MLMYFFCCNLVVFYHIYFIVFFLTYDSVDCTRKLYNWTEANRRSQQRYKELFHSNPTICSHTYTYYISNNSSIRHLYKAIFKEALYSREIWVSICIIFLTRLDQSSIHKIRRKYIENLYVQTFLSVRLYGSNLFFWTILN